MTDPANAAARVGNAPQATDGGTSALNSARVGDLLWLLLAVLVIVGTGIGVRNPWPADEPRFALIARDMVGTGDWLFPRVGGDLYPDKPPVFFWLLAIGYWLTGSLRASFLIPSFIAACAVTGLIYDLGRRLFGRVAGLAAALTLVSTIQFAQTMRGAQIDPTLCALTTLSLYGLLRHLLLGPAWRWYFVGGVAAGLGVVTKGVGFLPLLVLLPYAFFRKRGFSGIPQIVGGMRWGLVAPGFLLGVAVWLVPMLTAVAVSNDPALVAYRNEILFHQTVERYAAAWHHVEPWYYFLVEVIPPLWLPLSLLLFWLVPRWKGAWQSRDARVWLPLAWTILTTVFFSLSTGKRGVYLFPALPATVLAAAPYLPDLYQRKGVGRASLALAAVLILGALAMLISALNGGPLRETLSQSVGDYRTPLITFLVLSGIAWIVCAVRRPILAWPTVFAALAVVVSYTVLPRLDGERSTRAFMKHVLAEVPRGTELAVAAYKEQFLLYLDGPLVNFGHARWREGGQELYDAAAWLNAQPGRVLLLPESSVEPCFGQTLRRPAGEASGDRWVLASGMAEESCAAKGRPGRAILYRPPRLDAG
ncbi:MAG TPA: glycosyltransferase family 39 protein [Gammaproteobacteria bacterium]|nr:glycosyltransferase family 39 protein [Gammaproteobacteria bacterium]